jgi:hypothetical protein
MKSVGKIEIKQPNGEYFSVDVMKKDGKLVTGNFVQEQFLLEEWSVNLSDYYSMSEALSHLYDMMYEVAQGEEANMCCFTA